MNKQRTGAPAIRRSTLAVSVLLASLALPAMAQPQFDRLVSFGDSYADPNINLMPLWMGLPHAYPPQGAAPETVAASYAYVPFPYWLQARFGLSDAQMTNYAIGGSTTQPTNAVGIPYSLPYQVATWGGQRFGAHDLVTLTIGGNDGLVASGTLAVYPGNPDGQAFGQAEAVVLADSVSTSIQTTVGTFAGAGARNVVVASFSDLAVIPATAIAPHRDSLTVYGEHLFQGLQEKLQPLAQSGTRIFLIDVARLGGQIRDNLAAYGFGSYAYAGAGGLPSLFQPDSVHLSSHGFEVLAQYMSNVLAAPYSHALQPRVAQATATTFTGALLDRLDASRSFGTAEGGERFTLYAIGAHRRGDQDGNDQLLGDGYRAGSGTLGGELRLAPQLRVGLALSYTDASSDLDNGDELDDQATQLAGYLSYYDGRWFADALLGYGRHDLDLDRRGVLQPVSGSTDADTFGAALRGGYLFDFGGFRAGPVLGFQYSRAKVDGYREGGDPLLAYRVDGQTLKSKTGEAGVQLRAPFAVGGQALEGYLNLTWQHEFGDKTRSLTTTLAQAPLLPIRTEVSDFESRDYGVIGGGVSLGLGDNLSLVLSASSTFGRDDGRQYQVGTALDYRF
ncbi:outer membrane autotransporter barrel domain protein [compost metagenome]